MIESKMKAAIVIKELEKISSEVEQLERCLINEDKKLSEFLCKILSSILLDIEYPIIKAYPSLRPVVMLGEKFKNSTYKVVKFDKVSGLSYVMESGILSRDSAKVLSEIEKKSPSDQNSFFCLEIEDCSPPIEN